MELRGRDLSIAFPYNFHKETVEALKNRIVVEQVLEEVYAQPLKLKVLLESEVKEPNKEERVRSGDLLGEALKVLGEQL